MENNDPKFDRAIERHVAYEKSRQDRMSQEERDEMEVEGMPSTAEGDSMETDAALLVAKPLMRLERKMRVVRQETEVKHDKETQAALEDNMRRWEMQVGDDMAWTLGQTHQMRK